MSDNESSGSFEVDEAEVERIYAEKKLRQLAQDAIEEEQAKAVAETREMLDNDTGKEDKFTKTSLQTMFTDLESAFDKNMALRKE